MSVHRNHHVPPASDHERLQRDFNRTKAPNVEQAREKMRQHQDVVARRYNGPTTKKESER